MKLIQRSGFQISTNKIIIVTSQYFITKMHPTIQNELHLFGTTELRGIPGYLLFGSWTMDSTNSKCHVRPQ